ncbi:MAG: hypothetical protein C0390_00970 [Syntrophus sp. (in: bacteria)]|nr:hypothetical protein [Syntrophus sp. (in: bacteria)]
MKTTVRRFIPVLLGALVLSACAALPPLTPLDPALKTQVQEGCGRPFLFSKYRLVHALDTVLPDGKKGTAIGIMVADPRTRRFQTALMTLEGLVLFAAESGETLVVSRAVPPFDSPAFARSLVEDIRLAFFSPGKEPLAWGREEGGGRVCRFGRADGGFVDVLNEEGGAIGIRLYGKGGELRKRVIISSFNPDGLAERIEIRSGIWPLYTLHLRLIDFEAIAEEVPSSGGNSH